MSIRLTKINGSQKVWLARVAYPGLGHRDLVKALACAHAVKVRR